MGRPFPLSKNSFLRVLIMMMRAFNRICLEPPFYKGVKCVDMRFTMANFPTKKLKLCPYTRSRTTHTYKYLTLKSTKENVCVCVCV